MHLGYMDNISYLCVKTVTQEKKDPVSYYQVLIPFSNVVNIGAAFLQLSFLAVIWSALSVQEKVFHF